MKKEKKEKQLNIMITFTEENYDFLKKIEEMYLIRKSTLINELVKKYAEIHLESLYKK
jgi:hypothetical protein